MTAEPEELFIGYTHASVIGALRPDIEYPDRKVRASDTFTQITREPCDCADEKGHVALYAVFVEEP